MGGLKHSDRNFGNSGHSLAIKSMKQLTTFQRELPIIENPSGDIGNVYSKM